MGGGGRVKMADQHGPYSSNHYQENAGVLVDPENEYVDFTSFMDHGNGLLFAPGSFDSGLLVPTDFSDDLAPSLIISMADDDSLDVSGDSAMPSLESSPDISQSSLELSPAISQSSLELSPDVSQSSLELSPDVSQSSLELLPDVSQSSLESDTGAKKTSIAASLNNNGTASDFVNNSTIKDFSSIDDFPNIEDLLLVIKDTPVPNDGSVTNRAEKTLPNGLVIKTTSLLEAGKGVFTGDGHCLACGVCFGPYEGKIFQHMDEASQTRYSWKILEHNNRSQYFVDGQDESFANWMRYMNYSGDRQLQNMEAFQYRGEIFCRTTKVVPANTELLLQTNFPEYTNSTYFDRKSGIMATADLQGSTAHHKHKRYACSNCKKDFSSSSNLQRHQEVHLGVKPHQCTTCGHSFARLAALQRHNVIHTGEKPHVCSICGRNFAYASNIKSHMRTHTGEKPFTCITCGKKFIRSNHLKRHMLIHSKK